MWKLKWIDWLVIISALLFVGAHLSTQFVAAKQADLIGDAEAAEALFIAIEAAPIFEAVQAMEGFKMIFTFLIVPSLVLSVYVLIRRRNYLARPYIVEQVALLFFFIALLNFLNDFSYLLGLLAR